MLSGLKEVLLNDAVEILCLYQKSYFLCEVI